MTMVFVVRANAEQSVVAVTCVVFGCLAVLVYPWLTHTLFGSGPAAGVFLGTAIHDTSQVRQVTASGVSNDANA